MSSLEFSGTVTCVHVRSFPKQSKDRRLYVYCTPTEIYSCMSKKKPLWIIQPFSVKEWCIWMGSLSDEQWLFERIQMIPALFERKAAFVKNETALVIMLHLLKITSFLAWALHFETEPRLLLPISYMAHSHSAAFFCWIRYALQEKCIVCRFYRGILHFCGVTLSFSRSTAQFNKNMNAYEWKRSKHA